LKKTKKQFPVLVQISGGLWGGEGKKKRFFARVSYGGARHFFSRGGARVGGGGGARGLLRVLDPGPRPPKVRGRFFFSTFFIWGAWRLLGFTFCVCGFLPGGGGPPGPTPGGGGGAGGGTFLESVFCLFAGSRGPGCPPLTQRHYQLKRGGPGGAGRNRTEIGQKGGRGGGGAVGWGDDFGGFFLVCWGVSFLGPLGGGSTPTPPRRPPGARRGGVLWEKTLGGAHSSSGGPCFAGAHLAQPARRGHPRSSPVGRSGAPPPVPPEVHTGALFWVDFAGIFCFSPSRCAVPGGGAGRAETLVYRRGGGAHNGGCLFITFFLWGGLRGRGGGGWANWGGCGAGLPGAYPWGCFGINFSLGGIKKMGGKKKTQKK